MIIFTTKMSWLLRMIGLVLILAVAWAAGPASPAQADGPDIEWIPIEDGISYVELVLSDPPNHAYVARMHRANPNVTLESSIAQGRLSGGFETVSGMANRYQGTINYWGQVWGGTNQVVVAINGFYYDPDTGIPLGGQVHSGWYAKRFTDHIVSGFAWQLDRNAFIGEYVFHYADRQVINFIDQGQVTLIFDGINIPRQPNQLILYTPQYDTSTRTDDSGLEVLVEMSRPALLLPLPNARALGTIVSIRDGSGSTQIPFDHIVLSAHGTAASALRALAQPGHQIGISQEIANYPSSPPVDWTKTYASINGDYYYLKAGVVQLFDGNALYRAPRTAIAFDADYVYFIVVDGRNPGVSEGMTIEELALFTRDVLGATYAVAQDGGGSSTMWVEGQVVNDTYCNNVYCSAKIYLPLLLSSAQIPATQDPLEAFRAEPGVLVWDPNSDIVQRWVANGMLMVVAQPKIQSSRFESADAVAAIAAATLRLGPGTNYGVVSSQPPGSTGVISPHAAGLNGVYATGSYWWKVQLGGVSGWAAEEMLIEAEIYRLAVQWQELSKTLWRQYGKHAD